MFITPIKYIGTKFDKKMAKQYNYISCNKQLSFDYFQPSFKKEKIMDINKIREIQFLKLKESKKINQSPISYVISILDDYFNKKISSTEFSERMKEETRNKQFLFSLMDPNEIKSNQQLFNKEFKFADEIFKIASTKKDDVQLRADLNNAIFNYNKNN